MKLFYLIPFLFLSLSGIAQDHLFPDGIYTDLESLRTGNVRLLTEEYVTNRLKEAPHLLEQYEAERRPDSDATLIRYMDLFNKTLTLSPNVLTR